MTAPLAVVEAFFVVFGGVFGMGDALFLLGACGVQGFQQFIGRPSNKKQPTSPSRLKQKGILGLACFVLSAEKLLDSFGLSSEQGRTWAFHFLYLFVYTYICIYNFF